MSLKVGITGGIGAGKSLVAKIFKSLGIPVYNSDEEAKRLMREDPDLKARIIELFGPDAYTKGILNKAFLRQKIFNHVDNLDKMNNLVHPAVIQHYNNWVLEHTSNPFTIKEAALLFESGSYADLDKIILVSAPKSVRINRILLRDVDRSREEIERIIENQMSDARKKKLSDYVIANDGSKMVLPQVLEIYNELTAGSHRA